jgi:hypothetical protein
MPHHMMSSTGSISICAMAAPDLFHARYLTPNPMTERLATNRYAVQAPPAHPELKTRPPKTPLHQTGSAKCGAARKSKKVVMETEKHGEKQGHKKV